MAMATDWLGINGADYLENGHMIPAPSALAAISLKQNNPYPNDLHYDSEQSFKSMVLVDLEAYLNGKTKVQKNSLNFEVGRLERWQRTSKFVRNPDRNNPERKKFTRY